MGDSAAIFGEDVDPRVALAVLTVGISIQAAKKILALIHQNRDDDQQLADILAETEARLARRG